MISSKDSVAKILRDRKIREKENNFVKYRKLFREKADLKLGSYRINVKIN